MAGKQGFEPHSQEERKPLWQRLGWLELICGAIVPAMAIFSGLIRLFMNSAVISTN